MIHPVHQIADVVEIGRDLGQLNGALGVIQRLQNIAAARGHHAHMGKAVLGKAQADQGLIGFLI